MSPAAGLQAVAAGAGRSVLVDCPQKALLSAIFPGEIHASLSLQVHTLLKGLEKIAASADIPMLVAGDFNSVPGSAAHQLLVKQTVDERHPVSTTLQG